MIEENWDAKKQLYLRKFIYWIERYIIARLVIAKVAYQIYGFIGTVCNCTVAITQIICSSLNKIKTIYYKS